MRAFLAYKTDCTTKGGEASHDGTILRNKSLPKDNSPNGHHNRTSTSPTFLSFLGKG